MHLVKGEARSQTSSPSSSGSVRVCLVLLSSTGSIVDGANESLTSFSLGWLNPSDSMRAPGFPAAAGVPPESIFRNTDILNARLPGFPIGPGPGGNNARCNTLANLQASSANDSYYYNRLIVAGSSSWTNIRYNDGWNTSSTPSSMSPYTDHLIDGDPANDDAGYMVNSNAHLGLNPTISNRDLVISANYNSPMPAKNTATINVCQIMRNQPDPANPSNFTVLSSTSVPGASFRFSWRAAPNPITTGSVFPESSIPPSFDFTSAVELNAKLPNTPDGPGVDGYNARCVRYDNLPLTSDSTSYPNGSYFYNPLVTPAGWTHAYHDLYASGVDISTSAEYSDQIFDGDASNDWSRNQVSDGNLNLHLGHALNLDRTILLVSTYLGSPDPAGYFSIGQGNVFSRGLASSIINPLPPAELFIPPGKGILYTHANNHFGEGRVVSDVVDFYDQDINSPEPNSFSYYLDSYRSISSASNLSSGSYESGVYLHNNGSGNDLVIDDGSPFYNPPVGRKYILFVPGNLFIGPFPTTNAISVPQDGKSFLTFIVGGSIGVHPSVNQVDGIYIADGVFDSTCDGSTYPMFKFDNCSPEEITSSEGLVLNGSVYAKNGFVLQRINSSGGSSESFRLRPDFYISGVNMVGNRNMIWREVLD